MQVDRVQLLIGKGLRTNRVASGLTLDELARSCGCSKGFLSRIENGHCTTTNRLILNRIANALHLSTNERQIFVDSAFISQKVVQIPANVTTRAHIFVHRFVETMSLLDDADIEILELALNRSINDHQEKICQQNNF